MPDRMPETNIREDICQKEVRICMPYMLPGGMSERIVSQDRDHSEKVILLIYIIFLILKDYDITRKFVPIYIHPP